MGRLWTTRNGKRVRTAEGYRHEYDKYQSSEGAKKDRASRNSARRSALRSGLVHKGDGKDVDHKNSNPRQNGRGNLRVVSRATNRGKTEDSRRKRSPRNKRNWGR